MALNHDLSELFRQMAAIMDIKGESVFKSIAFSKVSRLLKDMTFDIRKAHADGTLKEIEGIGDSSRKIIEEYIATGRSSDYESLAASVPAGLIPMLEIPGLGPKTIAVFWKQRGVTSLEELVKAIDEGKLDGLKGVGEKSGKKGRSRFVVLSVPFHWRKCSDGRRDLPGPLIPSARTPPAA